MDAIAIGPMVLPMHGVLLLAGLLLATGVAWWFKRTRGVDAEPLLWKVAAAGLISGRLTFVLRHRELYADSAFAWLDVRDGGFDTTAGLLVAFLVGAELTRRHAALRRPLLSACVAGCALFFGGGALNAALNPTGAPLPDIQVRRLDGTPVALASLAGRPLVVNLWATWCPPCRREMPALTAAAQANPDVAFVFVNQGEPAEVVQRYLAAQRLAPSNMLIDAPKQLSARTGSSGYPTTLFYDAQGRLALRHLGELSQATVQQKIDRVRAQR